MVHTTKGPLLHLSLRAAFYHPIALLGLEASRLRLLVFKMVKPIQVGLVISSPPEYPSGHPECHLSRPCSLVHPHKSSLLCPQIPLVPVIASVDHFRSRAASEQEKLPLKFISGENGGSTCPKMLINYFPIYIQSPEDMLGLSSFPESDKRGLAWWMERSHILR